MDVASQSPVDKPDWGRLLASCCAILAPEDDGEPPALYQEAADLIAERYAASPDLCHFCESLAGVTGSPPWAVRYERHLRAILEANRNRAVRCMAQYALASVVLAAGEERQAEAEALFEQFCSEFDGTHDYSYQSIEQMYHQIARTQLNELRFRAAGKPAPEIDGLDLDDRPMRLSDYRDGAVLLNFWGTWCFPCMKLVPHERELVATYKGRPFDVVGVGCADDVENARAAAERTGMTWRSFRDQAGDRPAITKEWKILGFPTLYLIDHHGMIRKRWVGSPSPQELGHMVKVLVEAAERKLAPDEMQTVVAALARPPVAPKPADAPPAAGAAPRPGTGFLDKVCRAADGSESKYVVFMRTARSAPTRCPICMNGFCSKIARGGSLVADTGRHEKLVATSGTRGRAEPVAAADGGRDPGSV